MAPAVASANTPTAVAQQQNQAVRIVQIYGRTRLETGQEENYRARVNDRAARPITFRWSMGDGTLAEGNNVAHRYTRPGRYRVIVTARNARGIDTDSTFVTVTAAPRQVTVKDDPASDPTPSSRNASARTATPSVSRESAVRSTATIDWDRGGYTLMVGTFTDARQAENHALALRRDGYRTGIVVDERDGMSTVYRVVVGQFETGDAAAAERRLMVQRNMPGAWLVMPLENISTSGE